jgi:hypothetical protein
MFYKINLKDKRFYLLDVTRFTVNSIKENSILLNDYINIHDHNFVKSNFDKMTNVFYGDILSVKDTKNNALYYKPSFEDLKVIFGDED